MDTAASGACRAAEFCSGALSSKVAAGLRTAAAAAVSVSTVQAWDLAGPWQAAAAVAAQSIGADKSARRWVNITETCSLTAEVPQGTIEPDEAAAVSSSVPTICKAYRPAKLTHKLCRPAQLREAAAKATSSGAANAKTCKNAAEPDDAVMACEVYGPAGL